MLNNFSAPENDTIESIENFLKFNAAHRIRPSLLRDVKTEALLVFARTALERYFLQMEESGYTPSMGTPEDTAYVYGTLTTLRDTLQACVVNADYLITVVKSAEKYAQFRHIAKYEAPLICYYNSMAQKVANHFYSKFASLPEFLVICVLSHWVLEEEKSVHLYPFLKDIDFMSLIDKFEMNRECFLKDNECIISDIHVVAVDIVDKLKETKFKVSSDRVSKTRKKK